MIVIMIKLTIRKSFKAHIILFSATNMESQYQYQYFTQSSRLHLQISKISSILHDTARTVTASYWRETGLRESGSHVQTHTKEISLYSIKSLIYNANTQSQDAAL